MILSTPFALSPSTKLRTGYMSEANEVEAQVVPRLRPSGSTLGTNRKTTAQLA